MRSSFALNASVFRRCWRRLWLSRPVIEAGRHTLTIDVPSEPIPLDADAIRLAQVFANLLNNAAKYTERGGRIALTAERRGHDVIVSVTDTGIGITPEVLPRIFDMFTQSERALQFSQGGLGVGLSLVRGLLDLHHGSIEAHSEGAGQGSRFTVCLPIDTEASDPATPLADAPNTGCRATWRILVADDDADSANMLTELLRHIGHEVETAYDGEQAVATAGTLRPDVVLLDLGMPTVDGYRACRLIREQPWSRGAIIIALTGYGQKEDRRRTKEAGFDHYFLKPVDIDVLTTLLASLPADRVARTFSA